MTELQPSPPGYRVQDEAPGPPSCPPGSYKYASHGHGSEAANFKSATSYSQEGYGLKQSPPRSVAPNEYYRRRNDGRRSGTENDHEGGNGGKKAAAVTGYNDGHKKNTPGYKNDCGYVLAITRILESLGFTLPLNERDEASPPPTPPVRDASSLKGVCYGPGHEKYPSWPSAPERHSDEDIHSSGHSGSHRSKSWTDHTNYPKEKPAQYTRPHTKRPNPAFTQQLKTVMERCEKIPAETYESRNRSSVEEEPRLWPRVDREGKALGDAEYVVPSPPEREQQSQTLSHVDLEAYVRGYQDPQVPQVDLYRETTLTQAGLEEYTRVQHSQQASYAQSEGYHSYVSSVDSTTNTPFLDRLRRDSEAVAQRPATSWEDTSREGRDSVVTTSSGSASSSETLKWHGSMSDVSVSSGMPPRQAVSDRWHHGSMSDVSSVNGGILTQKPNNGCHEKWQSSMSDVSTSGIGTPAKGRHSLDKWQSSMNDRNKQGQGRPSLPAVIGHCTTSASISDICQTSAIRDSKWQESNLDDDSLNDRSPANQWDNSSRLENDKYTQPMPQSPTRQQVGAASPQSSENWNPIHGSMSDVSQTNGIQCSKQLIAHSARVQTPQRHHSESVLYLDRERSKRKLYPVSTTQPQESTQSSRMTLSSPPQPQLSVAERINELEKQQQQQQMRYTYLDPEKRHRVSDPTLKAIQKKALLSYYERHHQASWRSEPQLAQGPAPAPQSPQSPPPQPPPRPRPSSSRRASSASDYASGAWRENVSRTQNQGNNDLPSPKHQHSNSCSSLSTDLLGPVIVGPAISIDDWVPERPPKKPHLRNAYNERIPSPDLPPPSPPTVTESEVHDCDDPLPPPPPELSDDCFTERKSNNIHHQTEETAKINRERSCERHKSERHSIKRSKHSAKRDHDKPTGKSSPNSTKTGVQEQEQHQFVRSAALKHVDSEMVLENGVSAGFATHRMVVTGRSSLRYPSTQKLMVNGKIAPTRRISEERSYSTRPPAQLPDLISQRYSDSGNQRPAPQVPVEPRIIRQESMRVDGTRVDASGLLRNDSGQKLESSSGQRPQPQVPKNADKNATTNPSSRPNYLPVTEVAKSPSKYLKSGNHSFSISSPVKTGYEASSKLFPSESSPQKYHEPPKYVPNHHQRPNDVTQRTTHGYYALPPKYVDIPKQKPQPQCPTEKYGTDSPSSPPPPLAPRQNTSGRKSLPPPPRPAPPHSHQGSQSKASYLAYRRERGAPDSEGSYKRTMSPTSRMDDWSPPRDHDDPVLLRVTPHHPLQQQHHHHHNNHHQQQHSDLSKSYSVDALHHRLEERCSQQQQQHSTEVVSKLSHDLNKKLQISDVRSRTNENNNNDNLEDRHQHHHHHHYQEKRHPDKRHDYEQRRERLSPQSVEVLNDRNRQLERERRKLAASCEPLPQNREKQLREISGPLPIAGDDFFRERSATIEMTSQNIELLNRRNEKRMSGVSTSNSTISTYSISTTTSSVATSYDNGWARRHETQNSIEATIFSDRPPPPTSSPPRSPNSVETTTPRGAVPRRSGSCSSTSSSGRSIDARVSPRVLLSRSSPKSSLDSLTRNEARIEYASNRKVSSPTQTDNTGSWNRSNSPSRLSQTSDTESRIERLSSSKFRTGGRSSTSSISSVSKTSSSSSPRNSPVEEDKSSPRSSLCVSPQPGIEGLTLVQRTEVVLRVNAATSDAASQTDILEDTEQDFSGKTQRSLPESRKKLPEEIECEELSKDLASQLSPNDKLVPILVPAPEHKKPTDYVSGLFRVEATLQPRTRRRLSLEESTASCSEDADVDDKKHETIPSAPVTPLSADSTSPLSLTSAYFTTSEGKARFLTRYSRDARDAEGLTHQEDAPAVVPTNSLDLRQKKEELMMRLDRKLVVLRGEQEAVREEGEVNETLGARVAARVSAVARPPEASKYRNHVEEVGKITSLLLGLSGRLARAENALYGMPADHAERKILESKRDKLMDQLEEAKILKNNIDKRSVNMSAILAKYLNEEEFADYQHFINMKAKLIVDGREIQDKVKLGEEQLAALKEAID
ncbi:protein Shroom isoform X3 [Temnothorax curvispinosus]|nr:protein Shroom isoform X3 [Temnothorax curvispinosus]